MYGNSLKVFQKLDILNRAKKIGLRLYEAMGQPFVDNCLCCRLGHQAVYMNRNWSIQRGCWLRWVGLPLA